MTTDEHEPLLADGLKTVTEATAYTRLSRATIYGLMDRGELAYTKIGRRRLIPVKALVTLCSRNLVRANLSNDS
jgi:excisionase family DNA binding protein